MRANGQDLAYLTVDLTDAGGTPVYAQEADRLVTVRVAGAGALAGLGNGDPHDAGSFQSGQRRTFHGRAVLAIQAGTRAGAITVDIDVAGLPARRVTLDATSP